MEAPLCRLCNAKHWPRESHAFAVNEPPSPVNNEPTKAVNKRGAYPNTDHRRAYMRDYMARRRAA